MDYLRKLQDIESDVFKNMGSISQIVIDIIQESESDLNRDTGEEPIERDEIGAIVYGVDVLLKVYNPALEEDIKILTRFKELMEAWRDNIDNVNQILGIPRHKG